MAMTGFCKGTSWVGIGGIASWELRTGVVELASEARRGVIVIAGCTFLQASRGGQLA